MPTNSSRRARQRPLGASGGTDLIATPVLAVMGGATTLTRAQKQFNKLVERLTAQRQELARWQAFRQAYQQRLAGEYQPLAARLREKRIAVAKVMDRAMESQELVKRERNKLRGILSQLLSELLAEAEEAELVRLYDKYAEVSFGEEQQNDLELMRTVATEAFGVDVEAYEGGESPEELADWLEEQVRAARPGQREPRERDGPAQEREKSAKALAREALRDRTAEGGTRAVREVFRKLVSELHPDRETDPAEQARKTELMQRVNQAYKAGDLLSLLELQLSIEQIDPAALAGLAKERLRHYIHVLEEQSRRLRDELDEIVGPFAIAVGVSMPSKMTPETAQRALDADIRELKGILRNVEMDLIRFQDIRQLKQSLGKYEIHPLDDDELAMPDDEWAKDEEFRSALRRRHGRRRR